MLLCRRRLVLLFQGLRQRIGGIVRSESRQTHPNCLAGLTDGCIRATDGGAQSRGKMLSHESKETMLTSGGLASRIEEAAAALSASLFNTSCLFARVALAADPWKSGGIMCWMPVVGLGSICKPNRPECRRHVWSKRLFHVCRVALSSPPTPGERQATPPLS